MFNENILRGIQEHVLKSYTELPSRFKILGMPHNVNPGEHRAVIYWNAILTVLNKEGYLKEGVIDELIPQIDNTDHNSVWGEDV